MKRTRPGSTSYRGAVAWRVLAAVLGGYALTSSFIVQLSPAWPLPQAQAVAASIMLGFAVYTGVILWIGIMKPVRDGPGAALVRLRH